MLTISGRGRQPILQSLRARTLASAAALTAASVMAIGSIGGCARDHAQPLQPDTFLQATPRQPLVEDSSSSEIRPAPRPVGVTIPTTPNNPAQTVTPPPPIIPRHLPTTTGSGSAAPSRAPLAVQPASPAETGDGSALDAKNQVAVPAGASLDPAPGAAAQQARVGASSGQYMILGAVAAEVNGVPIFASKVLSSIELQLRQKAKTLDALNFENYAGQSIANRVHELVFDELDYGMAQRLTDDHDRRLAEAMTEEWRQQQIRDAGGSLVVARKRALDQGLDFDELVKEKYRSNLMEIYWHKKIFPQVQISAQDMRDYYDRYKDSEFTVHDAAKFRLIRIDKARSGGAVPALSKARDILERLRRGADFATIAKEENDDKSLADNAGFPIVGWIDRGSYRYDVVEKAVWQLHPSEISDLIDTGDAFYIAKMEERRDGRVLSFEDEGTRDTPSVQDQIREKLRAQQMSALRAGLRAQEMQGAIIHYNEEGMQATLQMAMQKYARWNAPMQASVK